MHRQTIARVLNLVADEDQQILNLSVEDARRQRHRTPQPDFQTLPAQGSIPWTSNP